MSIGGNLRAIIQFKSGESRNTIYERVPEWVDCVSLVGWLDLSTGDSKHTTFNAKIQESTHIFLCDYRPLIGTIIVDGQEKSVTVTSENARMLINDLVYEILLIDNPMNMNEHFEFYLKFVGGQR